MWKPYKVALRFEEQLGASIPRTPEEIRKMLEHRMPSKMPANAIPIDQLAEQVAEEVGAEEGLPGWATFKHNDQGLFFEGRCIRGHLKDCAQQLAKYISDTDKITAFKAKFANRVYVVENELPIYKCDSDGMMTCIPDIEGTELRFIQVMTRQGPRSTLKYIDYVNRPVLLFTLKVLDDGVITSGHLEEVFEYGSVHGMGAERSQGWGRYSWEIEHA